jgi:hypothetical protein
MLFLYRPRETWMPFALPRGQTDQAAYNRDLQRQFAATRPAPSTARPARERDLAELRALRDSGVLTEAEFAAVSARLSGG